MRRLLLFVVCAAALHAQPNRLLVVSIDGLDSRYLHEPDRIGVRIPTLRKVFREGAAASGVVGVVPTVTWPSHTTILTGVPPERHGILTNDQPGQPGQRWWFTSFLKEKTLWQAAGEAGMTTAAIWWPVTVGGAITYNIPEFWEKRDGHSVPLAPMARHSTPGLIDRISAVYPSFPRGYWSDTAAMQAVRYLVEHEKPALTLVHIADFDSEQHEFGAFSREAKAVLEHADHLLGWLMERLPPDTVLVVTADHGFENTDFLVRPEAMLREAGAAGKVEVREGLIGALDDTAAEHFRKRIGRDGIAREVPMDEVRRLAPHLAYWNAAFDTMPNHMAAMGAGPLVAPGNGRGRHGLWPTRPDYRASFVVWGRGVRQTKLGEISMLDVAPTLADILKVPLPAAQRPSLWPRISK
ncbi:MAG: alkaline phosphatase family protein [Bryobacterales bacterium]|nr:alkaline phosphatase family protein [Bryobacterales bacterium]